MRHFCDLVTDFIFLEGAPCPCDAIFCAGTSYPHIPEKAAMLYADGLAPRIFVGGAYSIKKGYFSGVKEKWDLYPGPFSTEAEFYTDVLCKNGVPQDAIIPEYRSTYTKQNADFAKEVAQEQGIVAKQAMLVCQAFHARRCSMYYQLAFPQTEFIVIPVSCDGVTRENWQDSEYGISRVMGEMRRISEQFSSEEVAFFSRI